VQLILPIQVIPKADGASIPYIPATPSISEKQANLDTGHLGLIDPPERDTRKRGATWVRPG